MHYDEELPRERGSRGGLHREPRRWFTTRRRRVALGIAAVSLITSAVTLEATGTAALMTARAKKQVSRVQAGTVILAASGTCAKTLDVSGAQSCAFPLSYTGDLPAAVGLDVSVAVGDVPIGTSGVTLHATTSDGVAIPVVDGAHVDLGHVSNGWHTTATVSATIDAATMVHYGGREITIAMTSTATSLPASGFTATVNDQARFTISDEAQIPAACQGQHYDNIIVLSAGDDAWPPAGSGTAFSNHPNLVFGLHGNDELHAGNSGDCLVGGAGDDKLYGGNAGDVLDGGLGNDYLYGGNGQDVLNGGPDSDTCDDGHAPGTVQDCETIS